MSRDLERGLDVISAMFKNKNMKILQIATCAASVAIALNASATITITAEGTMAPNVFGSPSFDSWAANAETAALNGDSSYGAAGPSQFNAVTGPLPVSYNFVTGFQSWLGQAPGPYAGELGNRASFVGVINGNGSLINISQLGMAMVQNANSGALNYTEPVSTSYSAYTIGVVFNNGNNINGGYTIVTSGNQDVNEIISVSHGNAYDAYENYPGATDQDKINNALAGVVPYDFTGTFTYGGVNGSATIDFGTSAVPEPTTIISGALLLLPFGLGVARKLCKRQTA